MKTIHVTVCFALNVPLLLKSNYSSVSNSVVKDFASIVCIKNNCYRTPMYLLYNSESNQRFPLPSPAPPLLALLSPLN